jgi:8-oxo-dGTP diphosphatase
MTAPRASSTLRVDVAIAVVENQGEFLIGQRPAGATLAGCWEFPGGKVEAGESPAEAAARECQEETGLVVRVVDQYPQKVHDYEHARVRLHFFACIPLEPAVPLANGFRWVRRADLAQHDFPPANAELIALLVSAAHSPNRDSRDA